MSRARTGRSLLVLGAALLLITGCSRKGDVSGWKATVEIVNGVKTVRNPETPRYGEFVFDLDEDLVIGEEKDEAYFFPGRATVNIDDKGLLYVCDHGNRRSRFMGAMGDSSERSAVRGRARASLFTPRVSCWMKPEISLSMTPGLLLSSTMRAFF
jgi:hypothetical protein